MQGWAPRLWRIAGVVIAGAIAATCVRSDTERCGDGTRCAQGTTCVDVEGGDSRCARKDQFTACGSAMTGPCRFMGLDGMCLGGACFVPICGDGIVDPSEACDDTNVIDGDSCSANCRSDESCGNGRIDLIKGEQCDEGSPNLSGDGCNDSCVREYRVWRDVTVGAPPLRSAHSVVTDPVRGVLLYGGMIGTDGGTLGSAALAGAFNDTWRWDGATWMELTPPTNAPRRAHFSLAFDPRRNRVVLFGGTSASGGVTDDTWEWDGVSWTEKLPAIRPPARAGASFACNMTACYLFGGSKTTDVGSSANKFHADTWTWDGVTWAPILVGSPSPRWHAPMVHDKDRDVFMLFGGHTGSGNLNTETWELAATWTQRMASNINATTSYQTLAYDERPGFAAPVTHTVTGTHRLAAGSNMWTSMGSLPGTFTPQFAFDRATQRVLSVGVTPGDDWTAATLDAGWTPAPRLFPSASNATASMAYDRLRGVDVILSDRGTWEWDGRNLYRISASVPTGLKPQGGALAFDRACGVMVAVGGGPVAAPSNLTWTYDPLARSWTQLGVAQLPIARTRFAMVYDDKRDVIVAFGGSTASGTTNAVYELSGACGNKTWQLITPTGSAPGPRDHSAMAFDSRRGVTVVFGGDTTSQGTPVGDTWEWDGSSWNDRTTPGSPAERWQHAMAYDPRRQRVVLFGGRGLARLDDSWEWNGDIGAWERLAPAANASARSSMPMAQDVTGNLVAVGGDGPAGNTLSDVIRLSSELSTDPREQCLLATADTDLDSLVSCADPDCAGRCAPTCPVGQTCTTGPRCGDGSCSAVEDYLLCPADCQAP